MTRRVPCEEDEDRSAIQGEEARDRDRRNGHGAWVGRSSGGTEACTTQSEPPHLPARVRPPPPQELLAVRDELQAPQLIDHLAARTHEPAREARAPPIIPHPTLARRQPPLGHSRYSSHLLLGLSPRDRENSPSSATACREQPTSPPLIANLFSSTIDPQKTPQTWS